MTPPSIVYVAGYGRSGSTLLDMLLDNADGAFGAGEVERFFDEVAQSGSCSCGKSYDTCEVWGSATDAVEALVAEAGLEALTSELRNAESTGGVIRALRDGRRLADQSGTVWRRLFAAVGDSTGATQVVDSSKSSRGSSRRITRLVVDAGLTVSVVHLVRDPRAVAYSEGLRGNNDEIEAGGSPRIRSGVARALVGWTMANLAVELAARRHQNIPVIRIRYEDLVGDPAATLESLGEFLGLDMLPVLKLLEGGAPLADGHGIRGNRMRRGSPVKLRNDTEWVEWARTRPKILFRVLAITASRYGYDLRSLPPG